MVSNADQTDTADLEHLLAERDEALAHQAAAAEVLQVIGKSMADARPVFERIIDSVERLFDHKQIGIFLTPGDGLLHLAARRGHNTEMLDALYPQPLEQTAARQILETRKQVYYPDILHGVDVSPSPRATSPTAGPSARCTPACIDVG